MRIAAVVVLYIFYVQQRTGLKEKFVSENNYIKHNEIEHLQNSDVYMIFGIKKFSSHLSPPATYWLP